VRTAQWEIGLERRVHPPCRERWWLHALLFALTLLSATLAGAVIVSRDPPRLAEGALLGVPLPVPTGLDAGELAPGLLFSLPMLSVLLAHEAGHYLAARRHGLDVSPPAGPRPARRGVGMRGVVPARLRADPDPVA